jgi:transposase
MLSIAHVGMDVHKENTRVVLLPHEMLEPLDECTLPTTQQALCRYLKRWEKQYQLQCYYEAGPLGYVPQRWLEQAGIACTVIAPSKTPRGVGERVRTDRRDARLLARQGKAGALAPVHVPTPQEEAVRALLRCRELRQRQLLAARHRVLKFLGVRGLHFTEGKHWTQRHGRWLRGVRFTGAEEWTWREYLSDLDYALARRQEADRQVKELAQSPSYREAVGRLCCFRGIDILSAMVVLTETIDFSRFPGAPQYMSYWGLTCSEDSSGGQRRQGGITKSGSVHARRIWIEAAWHYQHKPAVGERLARRQQGQPPAVIAHAWKAQVRLHKKFWRLARKKNSCTAVVAVARELAGFVWGAINQL